METTAKIARVLIWVLVVLMLFFQIGTVSAIRADDAKHYGGTSFDTAPIVLLTVAMTVAVLLFMLLPRGKTVPWIVCMVLGVGFIALAHALQQYYGVDIGGAEPVGDYLTVGEALYRHALPALIPVCMWPVWLAYRDRRAETQYAEEHEEVPSILGDYQMAPLEEAEPKTPRKHR